MSMTALELNKFGAVNIFGEIFPALDVILIYYFSTHKSVHYWFLFLVGILIDQLYNLPIGLSSLVFIIANFSFLNFNRWFILKDYITNLWVFCFYSFVVIFFRYLIFLMKHNYDFFNISIYFCYLTTILCYPIVKYFLDFGITTKLS